MAGLSEIYAQKVASGVITADDAQVTILPVFDAVLHALQKRQGFWPFQRVAVARGLYIWGGVGRGKSMLMDLFFEAAPTDAKRRVHFHAFMQEIHTGIHAARANGLEDPLVPVAAQVVAQARLLCFDEMQISDITDAMIVGRLFEKLFDAGVTIVTTSNRHPDELYKDGLNRNLFLPFIQQIKDHLDVVELASATDHRLGRLLGHKSYFSPIDEAAEMAIARVWTELTGAAAPHPLTLTHKGRTIVLPAFHNGVGRATFRDLCGAALGPADYLLIARSVRVLILLDIPRLDASHQNEAKRFVTLIDALYEARVRLVVSAAAAPEMLYPRGKGAFEFERTSSRLREMMSQDWAQDYSIPPKS